MPEGNPHVPGWDVWLYTMPANDVGGDLVDHQHIDDRRHAVVLGDVAGKALPAALLMVKLQATLRALVPQFDHLGDLAAAVNKILVRDGLPNRFATLVLLILTEDLGAISVLNAGHMPPLVIRGREVEAMAPGSTVLGMIADATFSEQRIELSDQDVLIVYSDGVPDAMNESGEFFGDGRLREAIDATLGQPVEAIGIRIRHALEAFVGEAPRHDDVSLVVLKRRERLV
jgi:phosphoserine phosphatase RsbU/P